MIVYQSRLKDGTRRFTHVTEVAGMEGEVITLQDIFLFDYSAGMDDEGRFPGRLKSTGLRPKFVEKLQERGVHVDPSSSRSNRGTDNDAGRRHVLLEPGDAGGRRRARRAGGVRPRWLLLGTAARVKADRDMAARMAAIGRPVPQQTASAVGKPGTGWIPESVSSFGERFAKAQGFGEKLDAQLEAAGVSLRSGEFVATIGAAILGGVLGAASLQNLLLAV